MVRGSLPNLVGLRSGHLKVIRRAMSDQGNNAQWHCKCDCGNKVIVRAMYLKETARHRQSFCSKQCPFYTEPMRNDYTGQRFGRLLAIKYVRSNAGGEAIWKFKCDCGKMAEITHYQVKTGHTQSCGCLAKEHGCYRKPGNYVNAGLYKPSKRRRTPKWLTVEHRREIKALYAKARRLTTETGVIHHVDHIYPLRGKLCSGLHVPWNLQILIDDDNFSKSNKLPEEIC
jgi:hypothetical protein